METKNIEKYLTIGAKDKNWYQECQALFEKHYGAERIKFIAQLFAATSINSSLKSNVRLFRKALHEIDSGLPLSNYLPVMKLQLERIRNGESIRGRKIKSFANAISGDKDAVVVDIWLLRAFEEDRQYRRSLSDRPQSGGATEKQYDIIELYCRELAILKGFEAREVSAMIWAGVRITKTGDRETHYKNVLEHQLFNMYETH